MAGATGLGRLEHFHSLACEFRDAARDGDLPRMDALLAERRGLVANWGQPGPDRRPAGGDETRRRRELLEAILNLDREAELHLAAFREEAKEELSRLEEARRGLAAYGGGAPRAAKWIDARG